MSLLPGNSHSRHQRSVSQRLATYLRFPSRPVHFRLNFPVRWFAGLGLIGSIGWAVTVPALLGLALGLWIDTMFPGHLVWVSLTLPLGLFLGCLNAVYWFLQGCAPKD
jgi:predicted F0F1-ATPase subunit